VQHGREVRPGRRRHGDDHQVVASTPNATAGPAPAGPAAVRGPTASPGCRFAGHEAVGRGGSGVGCESGAIADRVAAVASEAASIQPDALGRSTDGQPRAEELRFPGRDAPVQRQRQGRWSLTDSAELSLPTTSSSSAGRLQSGSAVPRAAPRTAATVRGAGLRVVRRDDDARRPRTSSPVAGDARPSPARRLRARRPEDVPDSARRRNGSRCAVRARHRARTRRRLPGRSGPGSPVRTGWRPWRSRRRDGPGATDSRGPPRRRSTTGARSTAEARAPVGFACPARAAPGRGRAPTRRVRGAAPPDRDR
jgi:hypothetical protein